MLDSWPPALILAVILCGVAGFIGLIQLTVTLLLWRPYPFHGSLWPLTMAIWALHQACLVGLLLRRAWSRWTAALLSFGWAVLLAWQIVKHLWHQQPVNLTELLIALGLIAALGALGGRLLSSPDVKALLGS